METNSQASVLLSKPLPDAQLNYHHVIELIISCALKNLPSSIYMQKISQGHIVENLSLKYF